MKRILLPFVMIFIVFYLNAKQSSEKELKTQITDVTVFLQGAQVIQKGKAEIPKGKSSLVIKSISPYFDSKSIQVRGYGNFTILSVNPRFNYLKSINRSKRVDSLRTRLKSMDYTIQTHGSALEILKQKEALLSENRRIASQGNNASLTLLKQTLDFYERELQQIKADELKTKMKLEDAKEQRSRIDSEISSALSKEELPTGEVEIRIEASDKTSAEIELSYIVSNAGWFPKYDVRVVSVDKPLELHYKADVFQNTGVDWTNVKLKLSNAQPNESGQAPEISSWFLNYARNTMYSRTSPSSGSNVGTVTGKIVDEKGEALPGVNVIVKGTTLGTTTDMNGNYSIVLPSNASTLVYSSVGMMTREMPITQQRMDVRMTGDVRMLNEVVVTGYASMERKDITGSVAGIVPKSIPKSSLVTIVQNQTTVEFEVKMPYSIPSNSDRMSVDLEKYQIEAQYEYFVVPKLEKDAFLVARVSDWDQYKLLEGEANLYFEGAYVGRSVLDATSLKDTLNISLGRDKSIAVQRTRVEQFSKSKTIGSNRVDSRAYSIQIKNKKSQPVKITVFDQIPVAAISEILISPTMLSNGKLAEKTGIVTWEYNLKPQDQIEISLRYEVKYPKREILHLE
jgi:hypothetical protein